MTAQQGFWLSTFTGRRVYPLDLREIDFCIEDIAHGLANNPRYGGQSAAFYSVAEHCVRGSRHASGPAAALEFLLHSASAAYLSDGIRPLKELLPDYLALRERMQRVICNKFGVPWPVSSECAEIDARMLRTEAPVMFLHSDHWWEQPRFGEPYADEWIWNKNAPRVGADTSSNDKPGAARQDVQFWPPRMAKRLFLAAFKEYSDAKQASVTCSL